MSSQGAVSLPIWEKVLSGEEGGGSPFRGSEKRNGETMRINTVIASFSLKKGDKHHNISRGTTINEVDRDE